ncbi:VWA domain-containing protein [candidate division WOR-3 bacterium]|nr:VWA domain-containing protein [candidate division WOR-3 bacterium]
MGIKIILADYVRYYLRRVIGIDIPLRDSPAPAYVYKPKIELHLPVSKSSLGEFLGKDFVKSASRELLFSILIGLAYHEVAHAKSGEIEVKPHSLNNLICDSNDFNFVPQTWPGSIPFTLALTNIIYRQGKDLKGRSLKTRKDKLEALLDLAVTFMRKLRVKYDGKDVRSLPQDHELFDIFEQLKPIMIEARKAEVKKRPGLVLRLYKALEKFWVKEKKQTSPTKAPSKSGTGSLNKALESVSVPMKGKLTKKDAKEMQEQAERNPEFEKIRNQLKEIKDKVREEKEQEIEKQVEGWLGELHEIEEVKEESAETPRIDESLVSVLRREIRPLLFKRTLARRAPSVSGTKFAPERFYEIKTNPEEPRITKDTKRIGRLIDETEVVFCFDRSGSMMGNKEKVCQQIAATLYKALSTIPRVRVQIIGFDDGPCLIKGTRPLSMDTVLRRIPIGLCARGGTNLPLALKEALNRAKKSLTNKQLVIILTDGDLRGEMNATDLALWAKRHSIDLVCIGVEENNASELKRKFGASNVLYVEDIRNLAKEMRRVVQRRI